MSDLLVTRRYAKALFRLCGNNAAAQDRTSAVLEGLGELFHDASISKVLISPATPKDLKVQILEHIASKLEPTKEMVSFIKVVVEAGRVEIFKMLEPEFKRLVNESRGVVNAVVRSVTALDDANLSAIKQNLEGLLGKKVLLRSEKDPQLLGGMVVTIGNMVIDMSLKSRLNRIARSAAV